MQIPQRIFRSLDFGAALTLACFLSITFSALPASPSNIPEASFGGRLEAPEADVLQAVQEVAADQIIHGTFSYEKERILYGAHAAETSSAFHDSLPPGAKVFYKVAEKVLAPRYFKQSEDVGTVTVRYIVQAVDRAACNVQIDAIFVNVRHRPHFSDGSVETAEYAVIEEHLQAIALKHQQAEEEAQDLDRRRREYEAKKQKALQAESGGNPGAASDSVSDLEQQVAQIRRKVEFRVKEAATPLKSAPFQSATNVQLLGARTDVVVLILTPYWYGVETQDGHRGWVQRSQVESVQ
jgi:hypothetical protein